MVAALQFVITEFVWEKQSFFFWRLKHTVAAGRDARLALDFSQEGQRDDPSNNLFNTTGPDKSTARVA